MPSPKEHVARDGSSTWRVRFRYRGTNTSETFDTLGEADAFASDLEHHGPALAVRRLEQAAEIATSPTLDDVAEKFFAWKSTRVRSDRTVHDYRRDYDRAIGPRLGAHHVMGITDSDVQGLVEHLLSTGLSPKTVCDRHALLYGILAFATKAVGGRLITTNPAESTDLPKKRKGTPKALTPPEWRTLYAALAQVDPDAADLALFLLSSGWRWSEATALDAWGVDDNGSTVAVTMGRVLRRNASGQMVLVDDGKGHASLRTVTLDAEVSAVIRERIARQGSGLVFTTRTGAQWRSSNFRDRAWTPALEVANLNRRPTPHWLRHTHVVWAATAGASLPELQRRIGHASITTTIDVYGRAIGDMSAAAIDGFAALRSGQTKQ